MIIKIIDTGIVPTSLLTAGLIDSFSTTVPRQGEGGGGYHVRWSNAYKTYRQSSSQCQTDICNQSNDGIDP